MEIEAKVKRVIEEMLIPPSELRRIYISQKEDLIAELHYIEKQIDFLDQKLELLDNLNEM